MNTILELFENFGVYKKSVSVCFLTKNLMSSLEELIENNYITIKINIQE